MQKLQSDVSTGRPFPVYFPLNILVLSMQTLIFYKKVKLHHYLNESVQSYKIINYLSWTLTY